MSSQSTAHYYSLDSGDSRSCLSRIPEKNAPVRFLHFHGVNDRALDTALVDDDAAIRVLNHNIDANGTGFCAT